MSRNDYMKVGDLKDVIKDLPDEMFIVIPVVDEDDVNYIYGFRKVGTAGILTCEYENEDERKVICLNGCADGMDIADQVRYRRGDVDSVEVLYGNFEKEEIK